MVYAGIPDYRTMATAMQSLAGAPAGQRLPGVTPPPQLTGSGPITPPQTTRGSVENAAVGSTGGDQANTANMTGDGGATMQLVALEQRLAQMLGRPPTREEIGAYHGQLTGPHPGAMGVQTTSGMPPVPVTPPQTNMRRV